MPQASTNVTFKKNSMPNTGGVDAVPGQVIAVELLAADPADLATNFPRVWINTTTGILKFSIDGSTTKSVTAT